MTSRQMIDFIEAKLAVHGVEKLVPDDDGLAEHARRLLEQRFAEEAIAPLRATIAERARKAELPADLAQHVAEKLKANPHLPWDWRSRTRSAMHDEPNPITHRPLDPRGRIPMGTVTLIAWCDHTFNGWWGCTRVSPACDNCYAAADAKRYGATDAAGRDLWDPHAARRRLKTTWANPPQWNAAARAAGRRARVFCMSWADVFDNQVPPEWRAELWALIAATPQLDWMLLTKRPQNIAKMLPAGWGAGWSNVWLGATAENMTEAQRRIPHLLAIPTAVHFLSVEPMLEPLDLARWLGSGRIDWVIAGGESGVGRRSRPMRPAWLYALRDQIQSAGAALFIKQLGSNREAWPGLRHRKGADPSEWPADLRIQEFPR